MGSIGKEWQGHMKSIGANWDIRLENRVGGGEGFVESWVLWWDQGASRVLRELGGMREGSSLWDEGLLGLGGRDRLIYGCCPSGEIKVAWCWEGRESIALRLEPEAAFFLGLHWELCISSVR